MDKDSGLGFLRGRKSAYRTVFSGQAADIVLKDLAKFCRSNETTFQVDDRMHALLEGRREVFLRIQQHLNLTDDQLWAIVAGS